MASPLGTPGVGPEYPEVAAFLNGLTPGQQDKLLEFYGMDPLASLAEVTGAVMRTMRGELPTIMWDNVTGDWVDL